jgi:hypothetical protein
VPQLVENRRQQVVVAAGGGVGSAECGWFCPLREVEGGEFAVFPGGGVNEPAEVVAVVVEQEGAGVGGAVGGKAGELGFGELTSGEVGDFDVEVKWSGFPGQEVGSSGDGCILETVIMTTQKVKAASELLQRYAAGERDFQGLDLESRFKRDIPLIGADLSGINLAGSNLAECSLESVNFSRANLEGTWFQSSNLRNANFTGANLDGAHFDHAIADRANFTNAILMGADLRCASMEGVDLSGANLQGAIVGGSDVPWEDIGDDEGAPYLVDAIFRETTMPNGSIRTDP